MAEETKFIEIAKVGSFTAMSGEEVSFNAEDLRSVASGYNSSTSKAPAVIGHPKTDDPAYAWVKSLSFSDEQGVLIAELDEINQDFAEAVKNGAYKKISPSFYKPNSPSNPNQGQLSLKHVGFLGAAAPAIPGLKPVEFAGDDSEVVTFEFADKGFKDVADIFGTFREFLIEKFGMESADKALPVWDIKWLSDHHGKEDPEKTTQQFTEKKADIKKEVDMAADDEERLKELEAREKAIKEREAELQRKEHVAFCESLAGEARILPCMVDDLSFALTHLDGEEELSFSENEKKTPQKALKDALSALPKIVDMSAALEGGGVKSGDQDDAYALSVQIDDLVSKARDAGQFMSASDALNKIQEGGHDA